MVCDTTGFIIPDRRDYLGRTMVCDVVYGEDLIERGKCKIVQPPTAPDTTFSTGVKIYAAAGACWLLWSTYRDGKEELENARSTRYRRQKDHDAARDGCFKRPFMNLFDAIVWPIPLVLSVVPNVVVWLNPK